MMESKADAFAFLAGLEGRLKANLPLPAEMRASVDAIWNKPAHAKAQQERLACRENVFLYHFALPEIFEHVRSAVGFDVGAAVRSLGCEYYQKFPQYAGSNGLRRAGYPFAKKMGLASRTVMTTWKRARGTFPLNQTFPDLALFEPFPFRIVFDAKFFDQDSPRLARARLWNAYMKLRTTEASHESVVARMTLDAYLPTMHPTMVIWSMRGKRSPKKVCSGKTLMSS